MDKGRTEEEDTKRYTHVSHLSKKKKIIQQDIRHDFYIFSFLFYYENIIIYYWKCEIQKKKIVSS